MSTKTVEKPKAEPKMCALRLDKDKLERVEPHVLQLIEQQALKRCQSEGFFLNRQLHELSPSDKIQWHFEQQVKIAYLAYMKPLIVQKANALHTLITEAIGLQTVHAVIGSGKSDCDTNIYALYTVTRGFLWERKKLFYIGKTNSPNLRMKQHWASDKQHKFTHVKVMELTDVTEEELLHIEACLIYDFTPTGNKEWNPNYTPPEKSEKHVKCDNPRTLLSLPNKK